MRAWKDLLRFRFGFGLFFLLALVGTGCATVGAHHRAGYFGVGYATDDTVVRFLASYGDWLLVPPFGYVWRPAVVYGWRPFYYGRWAWCRAGWLWISYEPFGWIVYHYGYWYPHPAYGWIWIPDWHWSPARVRWLTIGRWIAWAPLAPPGYEIPDPFPGPYGWPYTRGHDRQRTSIWLFVRVEDLGRPHVGRYAKTTWVFKNRYRSLRPRYRPPDIERVTRSGRRIVRIPDVRIQTVKLGTRTLRKPVLTREQRVLIHERQKEMQKNVFTRPVTSTVDRQHKRQRKPKKKGKN